MSLVKEALKPALRTVDAIMSKFGIGKKDAQKFLNAKFKREQVKGGAKVLAGGAGLWAASNFMKAKFPWRGRMYHTRTKKEETAYKAKALYGRKKRG